MVEDQRSNNPDDVRSNTGQPQPSGVGSLSAREGRGIESADFSPADLAAADRAWEIIRRGTRESGPLA